MLSLLPFALDGAACLEDWKSSPFVASPPAGTVGDISSQIRNGFMQAAAGGAAAANGRSGAPQAMLR